MHHSTCCCTRVHSSFTEPRKLTHTSKRLLCCCQALDVDIAGAVLRRTPSPEPAASAPARSAPAAFAAGNYDIAPAAEQHPGGRQLLAGAACICCLARGCKQHCTDPLGMSLCLVCNTGPPSGQLTMAPVWQLAARRRWSSSPMWRAPTAGATSRCAAARCWCPPRCGLHHYAPYATPSLSRCS